MNDPHAGIEPQNKSWFERLSQFLTGEPRDTKDLVELLRDAQQRNLMAPDALPMIEGVLQVAEMRVRDIMIPRAQMVVVPQDAELDTVFPLVIQSAHSRFPVIDEDRSKVVGILLAKDLLVHSQKERSLLVKDVQRPARFVPESKRLNVMLREFRTERSHMAIVIDEYGAAAGLVTIEDVLEQIVGEIEDEHDPENEEFVVPERNSEYRVKALMPVEEFNEYFGADFSHEEFDTVGGLVIHDLGHVPVNGEKIAMGRYLFKVLRADNRRIHLLRLTITEHSPDQSNDASSGE